jgi:hypothetical protein
MKTLLMSAMCILLFGCQSLTPKDQSPESRTVVVEEKSPNRNNRSHTVREEHATNPMFIGLVEDGAFRIVLPESFSSGSFRFTGIAMQEARPPETDELDLGKYEGSAIAIQGHDGGGWIYSARVVDVGGPIVTALLRQIGDQ